MLNRRNTVCGSIAVLAALIASPIGLSAKENDLIEKTLVDAKNYAIQLRERDECASVYGDNDWRVIFTTAAFISVIYQAHRDKQEITLGMLADSVQSLGVAVNNYQNSGLPEFLHKAVRDRLSFLPGFDGFKTKQSQTAYDQFGYNTMHVTRELHRLQGWFS